MDVSRLLRDRGRYVPLPSIEEAQAYPLTDADRASIARNRARLFVGSPSTVMQTLQPLIHASQADELMVITATHDHGARKRSYSLLADAFARQKAAA
jgi:alkanesulfonate monooxygenase SsuD/methylene tetrahydromethanopterin reductase-like flavin-dependent oxidoreductase (luciferase family)